MAVTNKTDAAISLVSTKIQALHTRVGDLANLTTTDKSSIVNALNEIKALADAAGLNINDITASATEVYSSSKVETRMTEVVAAALEGEDISDLAAQVVANAQADANFVSVGGAQSFTPAQQTQGRTNLGAASSSDLAINTAAIATNTAAITTNATAITANASAIGDEVGYDPVATINGIITF